MLSRHEGVGCCYSVDKGVMERETFMGGKKGKGYIGLSPNCRESAGQTEL